MNGMKKGEIGMNEYEGRMNKSKWWMNEGG